MTQLGWLEWRLTDEELPDLFSMVDTYAPEFSASVDFELEDEVDSLDPGEFANALAQDIAETLTGEFRRISAPVPPLETSEFMREVPRPRDSRPLIRRTTQEQAIHDSGEFASVPNTGTTKRSLPIEDSVASFKIDHDITAMFAVEPSEDDPTMEVDLSALVAPKRKR